MRPILRSRWFWIGVVVGFLLAVALVRAGTIHAQANEVIDETPVEQASGSASASDIGAAVGDAIGGRLEGAVTGGITRWFEGSGNEILVRLAGAIFSTAVATLSGWVRDWIGPDALASDGCQNILFQLPACATVEEGWVRASFSRFSTVGQLALGGAFGLALLAYAAGNLFGFAAAEAKAGMVLAAIGAVLIRHGLDLAGWLIGFSNAFAGSFATSGGSLPGYRDLSGLQQSSGDGLAMIGLMIAGIVLVFSRWFTLQYVNILLILLPLAVVFALLPGGKWLTHWWTRSLLIGIVVQVPIAIAIGQGQALVARFGAGGASTALVAGIVCLVLAVKLPGKLPVFGGGGAGSSLGGAARMAMVYARSASGGAGATVPTPPAVASMGHSGVPSSTGWGAGMPQGGPTYRSPLLPLPLRALPVPAPRRQIFDGQAIVVS